MRSDQGLRDRDLRPTGECYQNNWSGQSEGAGLSLRFADDGQNVLETNLMRDSSLELGRTFGKEGRGRWNACCCLLRLHDIVHALVGQRPSGRADVF